MKKKTNRKISGLVLERLSLYQQLLASQEVSGKMIGSEEFAKRLSLDPSLVRRDISVMGAIGQRGQGYDIPTLLKSLHDYLGRGEPRSIVLVGLGNIGHAVVKHLQEGSSPYKITHIYDINPDIVGTEYEGIRVEHIESMGVFQESGIFAILTLPQEAAQVAADLLIKCGIRGILNFAPLRLNPQPHVFFREVNVVKELDVLSGLLKNSD